MNSPEEIADALLLAFEVDNGHTARIPANLVDSDLRVWMAEAINADRAQLQRHTQAVRERAQHALAQYESDCEGQPWLYNPDLDDGANVAIALRDLLKESA